MIRHIVSWNFKPEVDEATRKEIGALLVERLEALQELVPCLVKIRAYAPPMGLSNCDVALYSEVEREEDLQAYWAHPEHQKVIPIIHEYCCDRRCTDMPV